MCKIVREIMMGDNVVVRVIVRLFIGKKKGEFVRILNRRDYLLDLFELIVFDNIKELGFDVLVVGKIEDIFNGKGIIDVIYIKSNMDGVDEILNYMK